ncbi:MAG: SDR family oxidoreductase [Hyphomonadaceae bacterium]|nr:SDR family oxidoreductase [Hyphomonadaceae bacterium]
MRDFDGKVVVVTGASTGLGAALAVGAAARGAKAVIVNYAHSKAEAEATAEAVHAAGAEAVLAQGDVSDDAQCRAIAALAAPYGRIDALANNAGVTKFAPAHGDLDALDRADFERLYAINVVGPFQMLRAARSLLEAGERASVLMVSSVAAVTGIGSSVAYAASKGALNTMTLSLARVLGPKIRINALCPGFIDTPWHEKGLSPQVIEALRERTRQGTPLQAVSTAEDIADAGLFFLSDASRHVTGETLLVDAGLHLGFGSFSMR